MPGRPWAGVNRAAPWTRAPRLRTASVQCYSYYMQIPLHPRAVACKALARDSAACHVEGNENRWAKEETRA